MRPRPHGANRHSRDVASNDASPTANPVGAKHRRKDHLPMPGLSRDLAVTDLWSASLERSRARRARAGGRRIGARGGGAFASSLLLAPDAQAQARDLATAELWELSLGRSRARRRAAELHFVPAGTRAKRMSLGALAALTVGPTASLAAGPAPPAGPSR